MATPTQVVLWLLALGTLGVGVAVAFRTERAIALQERAAERVSSTPPSESPGLYDETREHRRWTFRFGGVVLLIVGSLLLAVSVYVTFLAPSAP